MGQCAYFGSCIENPFPCSEDLANAIDEAKEISKNVFLRACGDCIEDEQREAMIEYPYDFTYYRVVYAGKRYYFFRWSAIESFFLCD